MTNMQLMESVERAAVAQAAGTGQSEATHRDQREVNISRFERWGSAIGGSALLLLGLRQGKATGLLMGLVGGSLLYRGIRGHCYGYDMLGIDTSEEHASRGVPARTGVRVVKKMQIDRPPSELYAFWRELENLSLIMHHLERVEPIDRLRSHWVAKGPFGASVEWEAEIINERDSELIAWSSVPGSDVDTAGSVHFARLGMGTEMTVEMKYNPPGGKAGATIASLLGEGLEQQLDDDLGRFKIMMEASKTPHGEG